jgi:hypothetical protein
MQAMECKDQCAFPERKRTRMLRQEIKNYDSILLVKKDAFASNDNVASSSERILITER